MKQVGISNFNSRLILLTSNGWLKNESILIKKCMEIDSKAILHIRKPLYSKNQVEELIKALPKSIRRRSVLHQYYDLAATYKLKGIHFKDDKRLSTYTQIDPSLDYSASFHTLEQLMYTPSFLSYGFLSPIFDSISKPRYKAGFKTEQLELSLSKRKLPIIALGGMHLQNIDTAFKLGFDGVAVLGSVWKANEPIITWTRLHQFIYLR